MMVKNKSTFNTVKNTLSQLFKYFFFVILFVFQTNKNLDMSINASNNFNLNITWSIGSTGKVFMLLYFMYMRIKWNPKRKSYFVK